MPKFLKQSEILQSAQSYFSLIQYVDKLWVKHEQLENFNENGNFIAPLLNLSVARWHFSTKMQSASDSFLRQVKLFWIKE